MHFKNGVVNVSVVSKFMWASEMMNIKQCVGILLCKAVLKLPFRSQLINFLKIFI